MLHNERRVLGLDLASVAGWMLYAEGMVKPRAGIWRMPSLDDMGDWAREFFSFAVPFVVTERITDVVIEAPFIAKHKRKGEVPCPHCGQTKSDLNIYEVEKLLGLVLFAKHAIREAEKQLGYRINIETVARSKAVKHFTFNGGGTRREMKARCLCECQRRGLNVTSEDIADAGAALSWYLWERCKISTPFAQPALFELFSGQPGVRVTEQNKAAAQRVQNSALSFDRKRSGL